MMFIVEREVAAKEIEMKDKEAEADVALATGSFMVGLIAPRSVSISLLR
jgi:hypothetical protein